MGPQEQVMGVLEVVTVPQVGTQAQCLDIPPSPVLVVSGDVVRLRTLLP